MTTPLSDEELAAFLQEAGREDTAPLEKEKERSLEELLSEIQNVTQAVDSEEPPSPIVPASPPLLLRKSRRIALALFVTISVSLSLGLSCYLSITLNREIHSLKELQVEMEKLIEKIPSSLPLLNEISEEKLLEELNPSFPEEEIIEPIDLLPDFSVA